MKILLMAFFLLFSQVSIVNNYHEQAYTIEQNEVERSESEEEVNSVVEQSEVERSKITSVETVCVTAYTVGDNYTPNTIMANGEQPYRGACAYNKVPLGTVLEINGELFTVCDRAYEDDVVDLYMDSYEECINFGVQELNVMIVKEVK